MRNRNTNSRHSSQNSFWRFDSLEMHEPEAINGMIMVTRVIDQDGQLEKVIIR